MERETALLTGTDFDEAVRGNPACVVEFYAAWCGPCRLVEPTLLELKEEYGGRVRFFRVDADAEPALAERNGVSTLPCIIAFHGGEEIARATGMRTKAALASLIGRALSRR